MSSSKLNDGRERWQVTIIYLKKVTDNLHPHIESELKRELKTWPHTEFKTFIKNVNETNSFVSYKFKNRCRRGTWVIKDNDTTNESILDKILSLHTNPCHSNIRFKSNDWDTCSDIEPYWMLAKIFMPYGNNKSRMPTESDTLSLFDLLRNCKCFKDFDLECVDKLCRARYSSSKMASLEQTEMESIFESMKTLLKAPCLNGQTRVTRLIEELDSVWNTADRCLIIISIWYNMIEPQGKFDQTKAIITAMDLSKLKEMMDEYYPGEYGQIQLQEGYNQLCNWFLHNNLMEKLAKEIEEEEKEIDEEKIKQYNYKRIGGIAGASVIGGTAGAIAVGVACVATSPVTIPLAIGTGVMTGIGYFGGKVGGTVVALLDRIN